ncbi:response regulator, partial [Desulfococcus sp.]|uniref:response regulator n=1 Tax=Desulfococcus sp. TaxID=2025834 RepID=UPI003593B1FF
PGAAADLAAAPRRKPVRPAREGAGPAGSAILLVEDNETIQLVSLGLLKSLGYAADLAQNGQEAIEALEKKDYRLVLMDMEMPVMDGYEATKAIRGDQSPVMNPDVPIIAMTAHAMQRDLDRCLAVGMDGYLTKPVKKQDLATLLETYLGRDDIDAAEGADAVGTDGAVQESENIFDEAGIRDRLDNSDDLIQVVMRSFVESFPERITELTQAYESRDGECIRRVGHNMKGSSSTAGATAIMRSAMVVEDAGRTGDMQMIPACIDQIKSDFVKLKKVLTDSGIL